MAYLYLLIAILSEVIATLALKASAGLSKLVPSIVVIVGYAISFILLSLVLKTVPVGIAYAIWSGLGIIFVSVMSYFLYGQKLDVVAMGGIVLIITGVFIINVFSQTTEN